MIKKIAITSINIYQAVFSSFLKQLLGVNKFCRFEETCSEFTKRSIKENGTRRGFVMGLIRLSKCQPFYKGNLSKEAIV